MADDTIPSPPANAAGGLMGLAKRKVFGVPIMVFAMIAAAVLLYFAIKSKSIDEDIPDDPGVDEPEFAGDEGNLGVPVPIFSGNRPPINGGGDNDPKTREEWANDAITWLIQQGESVQVATAAILKYLGRQPLSMKERELVDKALVKFGPPPGGYINVGNQPPNNPPIKQGDPPTVHVVRGRQDNNPSELTRIYYNRTDDETKRYLLANNPNLDPPYKQGDRVKIPVYKSPKYFRATERIDTAAEIARKNGTTRAMVIALNPHLDFPVPAGTRVRVQ